MIEELLSQEWSFIAFIFFGIIGFVAWTRWRDNQWIEKTLGRHNVITMSFGVNYFGRISEPGKASRGSGFLVLLKDKLVYRSRWKNETVEIVGERILSIYPDSAHKNTELNQSVLKIEFELEDGSTDCVAFRVPYPPQWMQAISKIAPQLNA